MEAYSAKDLVVALPTWFKDEPNLPWGTFSDRFHGSPSAYMYKFGFCRLLNSRQVSDKAPEVFHGLLRLHKRSGKEDKIGQNA